MTVIDKINRWFVDWGLTRPPPPDPLIFLPGDICTSDPERRVPPEFLGNAPRRMSPATGIAPRPRPAVAPTWTAEHYRRFAAQVSAYLARNDALIPHHAAWHEVNGPGGTRGPGSGAAFLQMHHEMVVDIERSIIASGRDLDLVPLTEWRPSQDVPATLGNIERFNNAPRVETPSWLTRQGGSAAAPLFGYTRLDEFKNLDELGRAMGNGPPSGLGYHGVGHAAVGGVMWSARAPEDPLFWLWHNHLDRIIDVWLTTPNGRSWAATPEGLRWRAIVGHDHNIGGDDPVARTTRDLIELRRTNPEAYTAFLNGSSFTRPQGTAWPPDALPLPVQGAALFTQLGFRAQTLATGLEAPTALVAAPTGELVLAERSGRLRLFRGSVLDVNTVATLDGTVLDIALDPSFARTRAVFVYLAPTGRSDHRIVRVTVAGAQVGSSTVIRDNIPLPRQAARLLVGADGNPTVTPRPEAVEVASTKVPALRRRRVAPTADGRGLRVLEADGASGRDILRGVFGRIGNVVMGPDGYVYITTSNRDGRSAVARDDDQLLRIVPLALPPP